MTETHKAQTMTGGEVLARTLAALGVKDVFALHGGHLDSFLVACPEAGIRLTDTRHEASAGHAADGYARAAGGRIGVCVTTAGPGFTNSLTAITNAYLDGTPVLFISGAAPLRETETNPLQGGFDQVAMAEPVTKWSHRITNAERIADLVTRAVRIATSGRPGPVFLEVPIDVMFAPAQMPETPPLLEQDSRPAPSAEFAGRVLALIREAKRPAIIAGAGAVLSPAAGLLQRFAEKTGVPVMANSKAAGILPHDHPHYIGPAGTLARANMAGKGADLVVLLGARMGMFTGGRGGGIIPHAAKVVQIDIEGGEIARLRPVDIGIVADCAAAMDVLLAQADGERWPDRSTWVQSLKEHRHQAVQMHRDAPKQPREGLLHPFHAVAAVFAELNPDTIVISDGGEAGAWVGDNLRSAGPGLFMTCGYLGCLGVGPGFAIGAARAHPGRPVVCFTGDGGAGFNIQEFDTMVRHRLPILTVVLNNRCWGMSQNGQDLVFGENRRSLVALGDARYDRVAEGFGAFGECVQTYDDIRGAVQRALASGKPACLDLITDPRVVHPVTVGMVGDVTSEDQIPIPYYENIPKRNLL